MRSIIAFFVRQHLFGDLLTVAVIGVGIASLFLIRREIFPNVNFDIVAVETLFPGASPEEAEKLVTNPIEQDLREVDGVKKILSSSLEGFSSVIVFLDPDRITAEKGKSDIQDVIDRLPSLPESSKKPLVTSLQSKQGPIIEIALSGDLPPLEMRRIAKQLEYDIESVPGVARVVHRGLRDLEIKVEADQDKLSRLRISLDDLILALKQQNVSVPGGTLEVSTQQTDGREKIVRTKGDFSTLDDVKRTVVRANDAGHPILVGDVAKVYFDLERASILTRTNGKPGLSLTVLQKEKTDAIDVVEGVRAKVAEVRNRIDPRVDIRLINDFSDFISRRLSILTGNLTIGLALVLLFLPLLIPFRFSLLIALGEPFAFLGTLLLLHVTDHSINLISMIGLIIVSGILVDDSIVVTENAVRLVEEGVDPKEAAVEGTVQIFGPVTASVLTTTVAFLPMAFMSGIFGKFVREVPIAVITALMVSLLETYLILPAHIAHWIKPLNRLGGVKKKPNLFAQALERATGASKRYWDEKLVPYYIKWLQVSLKHRYWVAISLTLFLLATVGLASQVMKFVLFPPEGVEIFFVNSEAPVGTSLENHARMLLPVEEAIAKLPKSELDDFVTTVGIVQQDPNDPNTLRGSENAMIEVMLKPESGRTRTAGEIIEDLRKNVGVPTGLKRLSFARVNTGPPTGKPVSVGIRSRKYEDILPVARELKEILAKYKGVTDIADSYVMGKEEIRVQVNGSEAAAANLSVAQVGTSVRAAFEGVVATSLRELDEEVDIRVSLPRGDRSDPTTLKDILIPNPMGNLVPLGSIARIGRGQGLANYEHEKGMRQIKVTAEVDTNVTSALQVNGELKKVLPELSKKYPNVTVAFGGEDEDTNESLESLGRAFALAIIGIFLILVLVFKSLLQPVVVLITVPLGIIAVLWAFIIHGLPLSFMGCLGIIALAGVIVNNAIVLVDFINQRRREGADKMQSIVEAAEQRVRPIFLTTITTVIGILPTAYGLGGKDMFVVPLAMALGWGLMFGSILTSFVFPASLAILDDVSAAMERVFTRRQGA